MTAQSWGIPPRNPALATGEVHAWRVALDRPGPGPTSTLSEEERSRADRFRAAVDRERFVAARSALRAILGRYLGARPEDLSFAVGPHGKPGLIGAGVEFNLSHSGGIAVVAVATGRGVGVDVEIIRPMGERDSIVARFLSRRERDEFATLPEPIRHDAFFRAWTCKEAYIKAIGTGLATPLDGFSAAVDPREPPRLLQVAGDADEAGRWSIRHLELGAGYAGAIVAEGSGWGAGRFRVSLVVGSVIADHLRSEASCPVGSAIADPTKTVTRSGEPRSGRASRPSTPGSSRRSRRR